MIIRRGSRGNRKSPPLSIWFLNSFGSPTGLEEGAKGPAEFKAGPEQAWLLPDDSIDDFVIELTDNDLDALLEELSSTPKGAA